MKRYKKSVLAVPSSFIVICVISMFAISEERLTITGTVNEEYGLAADEGHIAIVVEPEMVERLDEIIDEKVTGSVEESEGIKIITISPYEVIGKESVTIIRTINSGYEIVTDDGEVCDMGALRKVMQSSRNWTCPHGSFWGDTQRPTMTWCIMLEEQGDERQGDSLHSVWKTVCF